MTKIISEETIKEIFSLISDRRILNAKNILDDLIKSKDLEKTIDEMNIIYKAYYGEEDGTDDIKLKKYLIDKEELKKKIKEITKNDNSK